MLRVMSVIAPGHPDTLRQGAPGQQQTANGCRAGHSLQHASNPVEYALSHILTRESRWKDTSYGLAGQAECRSSTQCPNPTSGARYFGFVFLRNVVFAAIFLLIRFPTLFLPP